MDLKDLYQEIILDHGKNPRNLGKFENFNKDAKGHNPLCGDKVHVYLKVDENKKISDIKFEGHGCAISMASASIMTELIKGKDQKEVNEFLIGGSIFVFLKVIENGCEIGLQGIINTLPVKSRAQQCFQIRRCKLLLQFVFSYSGSFFLNKPLIELLINLRLKNGSIGIGEKRSEIINMKNDLFFFLSGLSHQFQITQHKVEDHRGPHWVAHGYVYLVLLHRHTVKQGHQ